MHIARNGGVVVLSAGHIVYCYRVQYHATGSVDTSRPNSRKDNILILGKCNAMSPSLHAHVHSSVHARLADFLIRSIFSENFHGSINQSINSI